MTDEPVSLAAMRVAKSMDNRDWTPVECLRDTIKEIESGAVVCDKLLVLRLNMKSPDGEDVFNVGYNASGLRASEIIAILEIAKAMILQEMGYSE